MDFYKKIIRSRKARVWILQRLSFIPDKTALRMQYFIKTGHILHLKNPIRFTEKIQYYKLNYHDPLMIPCVDKYDVRDYVRSKGFGDLLNDCYGVYDSADEIPWDKLPDRFVIKDTLGGGGNSVIIVKDKKNEEIEKIKSTAQKWTEYNSKYKNSGREWPYYCGKKHRIIIEEYLEADNEKGGLIDYKFFCINGTTAYLNVMGDRVFGKSVKATLFDRDFNRLPVIRMGDSIFDKAEKPDNYDQLRHVAETLSKDFPHVRVDLYNINGRIVFGELTFYSSSGYLLYDPDEFDNRIGNLWDLSNMQKCRSGGKTVLMR